MGKKKSCALPSPKTNSSPLKKTGLPNKESSIPTPTIHFQVRAASFGGCRGSFDSAFYLLVSDCAQKTDTPWNFNMDNKKWPYLKGHILPFPGPHCWSAPCSSVVQLPIFLHNFIVTSSSSNITGIGRLYSPCNWRCLSVIREWDQHMFVRVQNSKWPGKHPKFEQLPLGPSRNHIPHAPCVEDLPTFGINLWFPCRWICQSHGSVMGIKLWRVWPWSHKKVMKVHEPKL